MKNKEAEREREMLGAFLEQAQNVIASEDRFRKTGRSLLVGFESEVAIYRENIALGDIKRTRNAVIQGLPDIADVELGAAQIEFRTPPIDLLAPNGFGELAGVYRDRFEAVIRAAKQQGCSILRVGANPLLPIKNTPRTETPKYRLVPDYYNQHRPKEVDTIIGLGKDRIDIGDAAIVSLFQSFQVNLEAQSFSDACDKMNRSFFIAPYLLGLSANARFLEFIDTKIQDMRMVAWEKSHDTRMSDLRMISWEKSFDLRTPHELAGGYASRVGLPERYFTDIADYFRRMERFPFILYNLDAALKIAIGMTWLDARVKFIDNSTVVELRLLPTQPTIEEELLITLLYIGRLVDSQSRNEPLLPIQCVRENRLSAMLHGPHRKMWFLAKDGVVKKLPYRVGMKLEIQRAKQGLDRLGLAGLLDTDLLRLKLAEGTPSDKLARTLYRNGRRVSIEKMVKSLQETKMLV